MSLTYFTTYFDGLFETKEILSLIENFPTFYKSINQKNLVQLVGLNFKLIQQCLIFTISEFLIHYRLSSLNILQEHKLSPKIKLGVQIGANFNFLGNSPPKAAELPGTRKYLHRATCCR